MPASTAWATMIDDQVVLLDRTTEACHVLNASAALVWGLIDGHRSVGQVLDQLQLETEAARSVLVAGVDAAIQSFLAGGLVRLADEENATAPETLVSPPKAEPPLLSRSQRWAPTVATCLDRMSTTTTGPVALAGTSAEICTDDPDLARRCATATASLPRAARAATVIWVLDRGREKQRRFRLVIDNAFAGWAPTADAAADKVFLCLNLLAIANTPDRVLLHAGAVEREGRAVVVAGLSGHGKSTFTAALVQAGFAYLTDELVVIDPATRRVEPYPKALDLSAGSLDLLGLEPDETDSATPWDKHKVAPSRIGSVSAGADLALLVLLAPPHPPAEEPADPPNDEPHERVDPAAVEELTAVDALVELLLSTFAETYELSNPLDTLADLCVRTPAIRLHRIPPADAVAAVMGALDQLS